MTYIKKYWENKNSRAEAAGKHTEEMKNAYGRMIKTSILGTKIYDVDFYASIEEKDKRNDLDIVVDDLDSVSAIFKYASGKTAVLNFSSYKNPGGMFLNGSKAQEECLCHESFLYNVLKEFQQSFYDWNNQNKNHALYLNRGLYSPRIVFFHSDERKLCDVITCAAPNRSAAKYQRISEKENSAALESRIRFVLDIAYDNKISTLVLGAYGCGVFGQDPDEVATLFKKYLDTSHKVFDKVIFAIPSGSDSNLEKFKKVFGR